MPIVAPLTKQKVVILMNEIKTLFSPLVGQPQTNEATFDQSSHSWKIHLQWMNDGRTFNITKGVPANNRLAFTISTTNKVRAQDIAPGWKPTGTNVYTGSVPLPPGISDASATSHYVTGPGNLANLAYVDLVVVGGN